MEKQQTQESIQVRKITFEDQPEAKDGEGTQAASTQSEPGQRQVHHCANCDIDFFWPPTNMRGQVYCCTGCAAGGPCTCDYSLYRSVTIMGVIHYEA